MMRTFTESQLKTALFYARLNVRNNYKDEDKFGAELAINYIEGWFDL